ncbi:glutathione S-transferase family protein [Candidatus Sneabacter namystus]|uniref:Glutathione S-transferase family protein n=1 Tax=Candidatus Sneabacter namystus TaxID=2601646 RepID=A0A5C0UIB0_9RICK|nr:glutathione S-transferase family protein [Candidatus Sneabacter namystus]QEK39848.1 glutathione S-transferase family protein [Candidatus Sneabacter namystus]
MYVLYHHPSCPLSRQIMVTMEYMSLDCEYLQEEYWYRNAKLADISSFATVPLLKCRKFGVIDGAYPILEFLLSLYPNSHIFPGSLRAISEMRRLLSVINSEFYYHVSQRIIEEKLLRLLANRGSPRGDVLRSATSRQVYYLNYFSCVIRDRNFLLYDKVSVVDIALASHVAMLDYFNYVEWYRYPTLRGWYQVLKSVPCFRALLKSRFSSIRPPEHYMELDF